MAAAARPAFKTPGHARRTPDVMTSEQHQRPNSTIAVNATSDTPAPCTISLARVRVILPTVTVGLWSARDGAVNSVSDATAASASLAATRASGAVASIDTIGCDGSRLTATMKGAPGSAAAVAYRGSGVATIGARSAGS